MTTKFIDVTGKTEDEAVASALAQLGMDRDEVSVEILERAKKGFLGIGASPARVRVTYEVAEEPVVPVQKPVPVPPGLWRKSRSRQSPYPRLPGPRGPKRKSPPAPGPSARRNR